MDEEKMDGLSLDIGLVEENKLRSVFPQCFVDGQLDITKLLAVCGHRATVGENDREKYEFRWKGKSECLQLAGKRSAGALRPCPRDSLNWDETRNLYIEGDNLEVLKLLQRAYFRKVKMIYIDPPYNTGGDFIYSDNFADPLARYREVTQQTTKSNPEAMGRYHTNWLNMMYPRLKLAANLLRDDGVIFISIDDNEVDNLKKICNEVFGEENFVAQVVVQTNPRGRTFDRFIAKTHEYILVYSKCINVDGMHEVPKGERAIAEYAKEDDGGKFRLLELRNRNPVFDRTNRPLLFFPFYADPDRLDVSLTQTERHTVEILPRNSQGLDGCWTWGLEKARNGLALLVANLANTGKWSVFRKDYLEGSSLYTKCKGLWMEKEMNHENGKEVLGELFDKTPFDFPKSVQYIRKCILLGTSKDGNEIVLDFFSGSATTAHSVMQINAEDGGNRQFICIQLPEICPADSGFSNICEIGKERIRRAGRKIKASSLLGTENLDTGFRVFKLDSSNLKLWDNSPITGENALTQLEMRLRGMLDIVKPDRSDLDVVYEIALKLGQELTVPVVPLDISGKTIYGVGADIDLIVCLAQEITPEDALAMAEYAPGRIIFTDACFQKSEQKSNVRLSLKDKGIAIKSL